MLARHTAKQAASERLAILIKVLKESQLGLERWQQSRALAALPKDASSVFL